MLDQTWFEMHGIRQRKLESAVWIPLRAVITIEESGRYGYRGFRRDFYGAGTLAVPLDQKDEVAKLGWSDIGVSHHHGPYPDDDAYVPADVYQSYEGEIRGFHLVLDQRANSAEVNEWHLHQDLVLGLGLKRERDVWLGPDEGYIEIARLRRRVDASPSLLEIRAEHLRDYLCARHMALYVTSYRQRQVVVDDTDGISWDENPKQESGGGDRWEGRIASIHEGGHPFGEETAVFHSSRTDVDSEEDVPTLGPPTEWNVRSDSWTFKREGDRLFVVEGELWRNEWIEPAERSPRIRGDEMAPTVFFVTDAEGNRESQASLRSGGRWLWFRPEVVMALCHRRGGGLRWYTRDSGSVKCSPDYDVHFGVNRLGLVNVYAEDIGRPPEWQARIWAGHNVGPDGKVSEELLASQVRAEPADTQAPEPFLGKGLELLARLSEAKLGIQLLRDHEQVAQILSRSHRFRAIDRAGLFALAKDLARLTADRIDAAALHGILGLAKKERPRSLNSLELLLSTKIEPQLARRMMGPLVGAYELRHADAHLPSSEVEDSLRLADVNAKAPIVHQGYQLLAACVNSIWAIAEVLEHWE